MRSARFSGGAIDYEETKFTDSRLVTHYASGHNNTSMTGAEVLKAIYQGAQKNPKKQLFIKHLPQFLNGKFDKGVLNRTLRDLYNDGLIETHSRWEEVPHASLMDEIHHIRLTPQAKQLLSFPQDKNDLPAMGETALIPEGTLPETGQLDQVSRNFEEQVRKLHESIQNKKAETLSFFKEHHARRQQLRRLARALNKNSATETNTNQKEPERQRKFLKAQYDREQQIVAAMSERSTVAKANLEKFESEIEDTIERVQDTLTKVEITKINLRAMQLANKLSEKIQLEGQLENLMRNVDIACQTVKEALDAQSTGALIEAMRRVKNHLNGKPSTLTQPMPDTQTL